MDPPSKHPPWINHNVTELRRFFVGIQVTTGDRLLNITPVNSSLPDDGNRQT